MRKRAAAEFHRLDAHQTRKHRGEERKKQCPSVSTSPSKVVKTDATSRKFSQQTRSTAAGRARVRKPQMERWRGFKTTLTPDFVGVGLLAPRHRGEDDDGGVGVDDDDDERRWGWMVRR